MTGSTTASQLAAHQRRYRALARELADIGLIAAGTITHRHTRCGTPTCRCHADPPEPHGPYYQWTTKVNGKTVTRRLNAAEAAHYQEWISNNRRLRSLVASMRQEAAQAAELILQDTRSD